MKFLSLISLVLLYSCHEKPVDFNEPAVIVTMDSYMAEHYPERSFPEYKEYAELEGFYTEATEVSNFNLLQDGKLLDNMMWTEFDSLPDNAAYPHSRNIKRGVYMKVGGIRQWGRCYGHFGASESKLTVTKILAIDTTRTRFGYIMNEARQKGYYVNGADTCYLPKLLQPGKQYKFRGTGSFLSNDKKLNYELTASTKDGATVEYRLAPLKGATQGNTFAGTLNLNLNCFLNTYGLYSHVVKYHNEDFTNYWLHLDFPKEKQNGKLKADISIDGPFHFYAHMVEVE